MAARRHRPDICRQSLVSLVTHGGFLASEAGRRLGVTDSMAYRWVRLAREEVVARRPDSGRSRVSTAPQDDALVEEAERNAHQTTSSIRVNARFPGSSRTAIRRLQAAGLHRSGSNERVHH